MQLMLDARSLLNNLSGDRIRHEIDLILDEENFGAAMTRLHELGLLSEIHPALAWKSEFQEEISNLIQTPPPEKWNLKKDQKIIQDKRSLIYLLWFSSFPEEQIGKVCNRLKLPIALKKTLLDFQEINKFFEVEVEVKPSKVVAFLNGRSLTSILFILVAVIRNSR